jgi:membrane protein
MVGMSAVSRVDGFQRRHPVVGFPLAVAYKFFDDQGVYLAALITYYGFLSLFPLLLLLSSALGFVLEDDPDLRDRILDSTLSQFPIVGEQLRDPQGLQGSGAALVIGAIVTIYGALGVAQAVQNAMNVAWAVPRHRRPNPVRARGRSLLLVATAGIAVLATTTLSALAGAMGVGDGALSSPIALAVIVGAVVVDALIFALVFRIATATRMTFSAVVPGAVFASVVWQVLQVFGTAYVDGVVKDARLAYGVFAIVLGLLAWIFFAAVGLIVGVEINVVRVRRLYPRALLTPFTDNVDLTNADRRSYTDAAVAQRHKGFEQVIVSFDPSPSPDHRPEHHGRSSDSDPPPVNGLSATDAERSAGDRPSSIGGGPQDG